MEVFFQALINGLLIGCFYSLIGMGQSLVYGTMKIINFAHGEMIMIGMYLTFVCSILGLDPYLSLFFVAICAFGIGVLVQYLLIGPALEQKNSFTNTLFLTLGLSVLYQSGCLVIFSSINRMTETSYSGITLYFGNISVLLPKLISFCFFIFITALFFIFIKFTSLGKMIRAVAQNPVGAQTVGIPIKTIYMISQGISCALAGIAGNLITQFYYTRPTVGMQFNFKALIVLALGGFSSLNGVFIAGILLGIVENIIAVFVGLAYKDITEFILIIAIMIISQMYKRKKTLKSCNAVNLIDRRNNE